MGADIYLESKSNACFEKNKPLFDAAVKGRDSLGKHVSKKEKDEAQALVNKYYNAMYEEGYFRDSYNDSSLLWQLGLSWWTDVGELVNKKGYMPVTKMKKFKTMLEDRDVAIDLGKEEKGTQWGFADCTEAQLKEWYDHFQEKKIELIKMVSVAIELKEPLRCSI
jgi:hypothetical protein